MNCPGCGNKMEKVTAGDITVGACRNGCGGLWFDKSELKKLSDLHRTVGAVLLDIERDVGIRVDHYKMRMCPACEGIIMVRHFYSFRKNVAVDECPNCGGLWVDYGNLGAIRSQFGSEEEKIKAADDYFYEILAIELQRMREESEEKQQKACEFALLFRFLCPREYQKE